MRFFPQLVSRYITVYHMRFRASHVRLVKDGGYVIPVGTWVGVPMGMGMGPYLVTHQKPLPMSTHDPYDILVG